MTNAHEAAPLGKVRGTSNSIYPLQSEEAGSENADPGTVAEAGTPPSDGMAAIPQREEAQRGSTSPSLSTRGEVTGQRPGFRFVVFASIGAGVFGAGLGIQIALVHYLHVGATAGYIVQGIVSIELSFALNRYLTWRDRNIPFWRALWRFNTQKALVTLINMVAYAIIVRLGVQYVAANLGLTAVFTPLNYFAAHYWSFRARAGGAAKAEQASARARDLLPTGPLPTVSAVIPCKNNPSTIRATVDALLRQDYPALEEIFVVGDVNDPSWMALADVTDPRLIILEQEQTSGQRDPNVKRHKGISKSRSDVIALVDSDVVVDADWLSWAVVMLSEQGGGLVAGGMRSIHDTFWGRFVDQNVLAAKTPRLPRPYNVTADNFGKHGFKPPITANAVLTRKLYERCPLDVAWSYGYEDYEWFWRLTQQPGKILFSGQLTAAHHHRSNFRQLVREYQRSARGCAHFIRAHRDCPLARKRLRQVTLLPLAAAGGLVGLVAAAWTGHLLAAVTVLGAVAALLTVREIWNSRSVEAVVYPLVGLALCMQFTWSLLSSLVRLTVADRGTVAVDRVPHEANEMDRSRPEHEAKPGWPSLAGSWRRLPLAAILSLQAALSLSLVWINTAFGEEASFLLQGRLEWAHWLNGSPVPAFTGPGAAQIYPPLGALAAYLGGLAGARILSLCFTLGATALLYTVAQRLFGEWTAIIGAALWAVSTPVIGMAFATPDALSCFLVAVAVWTAVLAASHRRHGELVALTVVLLAIACAADFSLVNVIPAVVAFSVLVWRMSLGTRMAIRSASWLAAGFIIVEAGLFSFLHLWAGAIHSTFTGARTTSGADAASVVRSVWSWEGLMLALAAAGVVAAFANSASRDRRLLLVTLFGSALLIPAYQILVGTGSWLLGPRVAAGTWLLAMGAGYSVATLARLWQWKCVASAAAFILFLVYPAITGTWYARASFREWPNVGSLVAQLRPLVNANPGPIFASMNGSTDTILEFYLGDDNWQRWQAVSWRVPSIASGSAALVILMLNGSFDTAELPERAANSSSKPSLDSTILQLASGQGQYRLAKELVYSPSYRMRLAITYKSGNPTSSTGIFALWQRVATKD